MKQIKLVAAILFALLFSNMNSTHAQISSKEATMSLGNKPAFVIDVEGANIKMVEKQWKSFIKDFGKAERNKKAKEYFTLQTNIPSLNGPADVYMKTEEGKDMTRILIFVDNGEKFISDEDSEAGAIEKFTLDFDMKVRKEVARVAMEDGEKELKSFNKNLTKLEKKNTKLHDDIAKFEKRIEQAEADIQQNLLDQDAAKENIEMQKEKVGELTEAYNNIGKG